MNGAAGAPSNRSAGGRSRPKLGATAADVYRRASGFPLLFLLILIGVWILGLGAGP
jgi:hypothetical protein